jgi:acetate kinase
MILLFNPEASELHWCFETDGMRTTGSVDLGGDWRAAVAALLPDDARVDAIGYVLHQGGDVFADSFEPVTPDTIERAESVAQLAHEHTHQITFALLRYWAKAKPAVPQALFSETAFFADLAAEVRDYAVPPKITQRGIHRRGGNGLCHEQSWEQARALTGGAASEVISVYLGDRSDVAAIREGRPVETSIGLTHLEGVMSAQGCGDIDPTIIFQLAAAGMHYSVINRLLSTQSGFAGLAGRPCDLEGLLAGEAGPELLLARRMLVYQLVKYVGALMASLGGADTLVFAAEEPLKTLPLAREVCDALNFLGVRCDWASELGPFPYVVSSKDSAIKVVLARYDLWETMANRVSQLGDSNKEMKI